MGQMQEVNDVREYDVEDSKKTTTAKKKEAGLQLPSALKEGYVGGTHTPVQQPPPRALELLSKGHPWAGSGGAGCLDTENTAGISRVFVPPCRAWWCVRLSILALLTVQHRLFA